MGNAYKIQFFKDQKRYELESIQSSISNWQRTKFYLTINVYIIRFWKNKQRKKDIERCDKEIEKLNNRWVLYEAKINKKIESLYPKLKFELPVFHQLQELKTPGGE